MSTMGPVVSSISAVSTCCVCEEPKGRERISTVLAVDKARDVVDAQLAALHCSMLCK